jgi:hypothetical protein
MITAVAARWLLTVVFAAAGLGAALPRRGHHGAADAAGPVPVVSCVVMCAALTAMTWRSEPAAAAWAQAAVFGCAALWSALASLAEHRGLGGRYERYHQVPVKAVGQRPLLVQPRAAVTAAG